MALSNYSELKTAIQDWMARSDLAGSVPDWITLAEARLNRELQPVETDQTLTGVVDSREISVSAYSVVEALTLYLRDDITSDEREVTEKSGFPFEGTAGSPRFWDYDQTAAKIIFDCPLDQAYTFRLRFRQRFALSDSVTTNWLLTNHPDAYLAASIVWGGGFVQNIEQAAAYKALLDEALPSIRSTIAQSKRAILGVDLGLTSNGRAVYDGVS